MTRWQLGNQIGESSDTIYRWEDPKNDKAFPEPDVVDRMASILKDPTLWHLWMYARYESYRKRHIESQQLGLIACVMRVRRDVGDLVRLQDKVECDVIDGKFDDPLLRDTFKREASETIESLRQVVDLLEAS